LKKIEEQSRRLTLLLTWCGKVLRNSVQSTNIMVMVGLMKVGLKKEVGDKQVMYIITN